MFFHSRSIFEKFHMTCFWCRVSERLTTVVTFCIWVSTGWVGWANNIFCCTFSCACAHTHTHARASCYATVTSCYAAVRCLGLARTHTHRSRYSAIRFLAFARTRHATMLYVLWHLHAWRLRWRRRRWWWWWCWCCCCWWWSWSWWTCWWNQSFVFAPFSSPYKMFEKWQQWPLRPGTWFLIH